MKSITSIIPLLFLIKYGESNNEDYFNERYDYVTSVIKDKTDIVFRNDYSDLNKPYINLTTLEGFTFITKEKRDKRVYYILSPSKQNRLLANVGDKNELLFKIDERSSLLNKQNWICAICHNKLTITESKIDYVIPIFRGGSKDDLQVICKSCFEKKKQKCKGCVEICSKETCPILNEKVIKNIMTIPKMAMKKLN